LNLGLSLVCPETGEGVVGLLTYVVPPELVANRQAGGLQAEQERDSALPDLASEQIRTAVVNQAAEPLLSP
jgi:hypothetical protein